MIKLNLSDSKIFLTADTHLKHTKNVVYSKCPYGSIEEYDNAIINNINSVVGKDDHIFFLGDFIFTSRLDIINDYYSRINGIKHLILGNHCIRNRMYRDSVVDIFEGRVYDSLVMAHGNDIYYLSHFPYQYFTGVNLHGHVHTGVDSMTEVMDVRKNQYDVGVYNNNYYPISLKDIKLKLLSR